MTTPLTNPNYNIPFKNDTIIKSEWHYSLWNRKQVRILVDSSQETPSRLLIQEIVQCSLAYLLNKLLKFVTGNKSSYLDKHVHIVREENILPNDLILPFSLQKQQAIAKIQHHVLIEKTSKLYGQLTKLGSQLFENAVFESQEVKLKVLDMNRNILTLAGEPFNTITFGERPITELQTKYYEFKEKADLMIKEYTAELEKLMDKNQRLLEEVEVQS